MKENGKVPPVNEEESVFLLFLGNEGGSTWKGAEGRGDFQKRVRAFRSLCVLEGETAPRSP